MASNLTHDLLLRVSESGKMMSNLILKCKSGKLMSNCWVLESNTQDLILNRVDASNTEEAVEKISVRDIQETKCLLCTSLYLLP